MTANREGETTTVSICFILLLLKFISDLKVWAPKSPYLKITLPHGHMALTGYNIPPVCWAVGSKQNELKVNKSVEAPEHIECDTCPQNEYPQGGGGKACKNTIKLAIIPPDFEEGDLPYLISFPPTSNTPFREYMESISKAGMHYMQAVTTISFDPKVAYAKPICTLGSKHARMKDILPARERGKEWVMREPFIPED